MVTYLQKQSRAWLHIVGFSLIGLLAVLDYLTGPQLSFSIFYLLPIVMLAWFGRRRSAIVASIVAGLAWLSVDLLGGSTYMHPGIPFWNATVRFGFFLIVTIALSSLRAAQDRQELLQQFIVHDLRAPLSNMMTGLQLLADMAREVNNPDEIHLIELSKVSADRMLILINSLLDLARLENGQLSLQPGPVAVGELLDQTVRDMGLWAEQKDLTLAIAGAVEAGTAWADSTITERVLTNLLGNAVRFSPRGSTVTVAAGPAADGHIAISVSDQGAGVPAKWTGRVFDKYAQVDTRREKGTQGFGLGLAFCRLAVEAQGGAIWLESPPEGGTTVTFTLPVSPGGQRPESNRRPVAVARHPA